MVSSCFLWASSCVSPVFSWCWCSSLFVLVFFLFVLFFLLFIVLHVWIKVCVSTTPCQSRRIISFHLAAKCCLTFRYYPGYFIVSHLLLQQNKNIYCPFPQMVILFTPEGEGRSNNDDCETFKSGRLPKALEKGESPQGAFQIIVHASALQMAARDRVHAFWIIIELIKRHLTSVLNVGEILLVFFWCLLLAWDRMTPVQIAGFESSLPHY